MCRHRGVWPLLAREPGTEFVRPLHARRPPHPPRFSSRQIFKGKALHQDSATLEEARVVQAQPGSPKAKLMLVGSTASEVEAARGPPPGRARGAEVRNDLDGVVIPEGYKRVSLNYGVPPPDTSPYR